MKQINYKKLILPNIPYPTVFQTRRNCWNNMQKNMDLPILFILLMMVSPVQDLIAQAFLP